MFLTCFEFFPPTSSSKYSIGSSLFLLDFLTFLDFFPRTTHSSKSLTGYSFLSLHSMVSEWSTPWIVVEISNPSFTKLQISFQKADFFAYWVVNFLQDWTQWVRESPAVPHSWRKLFSFLKLCYYACVIDTPINIKHIAPQNGFNLILNSHLNICILKSLNLKPVFHNCQIS